MLWANTNLLRDYCGCIVCIIFVHILTPTIGSKYCCKELVSVPHLHNFYLWGGEEEKPLSEVTQKQETLEPELFRNISPQLQQGGYVTVRGGC